MNNLLCDFRFISNCDSAMEFRLQAIAPRDRPAEAGTPTCAGAPPSGGRSVGPT